MEPFGKTKKTQCEEWVKRDNAVIAPCQHIPFYDLVVDEAKGDILVDLDNNHYVDFLSSASSLNIGSRRPEIVQAITEQMNKCIQFSPVYSYNVPMIEYAEELVKLFPQKEPGETIMLSYSNCGSEANDAAIKFCRGATKRSKIIAFTNSYHGNTYGSSTLSACTEKMHEGIGPLLPDVYHFPFYGIDVPDDECERDCLREIETAFRTYLPANEVAAVIIEPMQGDGGMLPAHHIFMRKLSSLCRENGILFIAEEVQLAFWRTGKCFSIEHYLEDDANPDGIIMGKSAGGGSWRFHGPRIDYPKSGVARSYFHAGRKSSLLCGRVGVAALYARGRISGGSGKKQRGDGAPDAGTDEQACRRHFLCQRPGRFLWHRNRKSCVQGAGPGYGVQNRIPCL